MLIGRRTIGTVGTMSGILSIPTPFVESYNQMIQYNSEYLVQPTERINYIAASVSDHAFARNSLVEQFQGDWLLMLDTDHTFEPDILARMLHFMGKYDLNVLCVPYVYKGDPHPPVLFGWNPKTKMSYKIGDWDRKAEVMPIHSSGAGCLLVRKGVYDLMAKKFPEGAFCAGAGCKK